MVGVNTNPKITRPCDWTFETKLTIVCDSFFRKRIFTVLCLFLLQPTTHKACYYREAATSMVAIQKVMQTLLFFAL